MLTSANSGRIVIMTIVAMLLLSVAPEILPLRLTWVHYQDIMSPLAS